MAYTWDDAAEYLPGETPAQWTLLEIDRAGVHTFHDDLEDLVIRLGAVTGDRDARLYVMIRRASSAEEPSDEEVLFVLEQLGHFGEFEEVERMSSRAPQSSPARYFRATLHERSSGTFARPS
jgi:hypothetical protein